MKKLIEKFIKGLNKDGILSESQIEEFESFGAEIQKMVDEAGCKAKKEAEEVAEKEADEKEEEIDESIKRIFSKIDEINKKDQEISLCKFRESIELTTKEEDIVENISKYLDGVVEEHLPEQAVVDYAKLDRLQKTVESIRESVIVSDDQVQEKISTTLESIQEELEQKSTLLDDSIKRNIDFKAELNSLKATKVLEEKVADLPDYEVKKITKHFTESSVDEIESEFAEVLESIRSKDYEVEQDNKVEETIKEELIEETVETDIGRYARLAERYYGTGSK